MSLICLPCAGGTPAMYASWAAGLPPDVAVLAARLPGREARIAEGAHTNMEAFLADFVPQLARVARRPYGLFGHSMGALMSYAILKSLPQTIEPPRAAFLSAHRPPHLSLGRDPIYDHPKERFLESVKAMGGIPEEVWAHQDLLDLIEPTMRADFTLCETYPRGSEHHVPNTLNVPIHVFAGTQDQTASPDAMKKWGDLCAGDFNFTVMEGGHFYLRPQQSALLKAIGDALRIGPAGR